MTGRTDTASRFLAAPSREVYAAIVDPDRFVAWLPPRGMTGNVEAFEPRPGGRFRLRLRYDDPADAAAGKSAAGEDIVEGRFVALEPARRVELAVTFEAEDPAFAGVMRLAFEIAPEGEGTRLTIVASNVPRGISHDDHEAGLASTLDNLAAHLA